jgi:hypothetical protein
LPFLGILAYRKGRLIFFNPYHLTDAVSGERQQYWILDNKWRRIMGGQPIPGLITKKTRVDPDLPVDIEQAVRASLNMNENRGLMPITKVRRYTRKGSPHS